MFSSKMIDIIVLAIVAILVIKKLFSILGRDTGDPLDNNLDPFFKELYAKNAKKDSNAQKVDIEIVSAAEAALPQNIRDVFDSIRKIDALFSADSFIKGAKAAFMIIIQAFANCDKDSLKRLVSNPALKDFSTNIDSRIAQKQRTDKSIVGINEIEIISAKLDGDTATIIVKIASDQITALKDYLGNILDGNPSIIIAHNDIWTFERNLKKDSVWFLTSTGAAS